MPYNGPNVQPRQGDYMMQGALSVSEGIQKALKNYEDEKRKKQFNEGVFEMLKDQKDSQGQPYVPIEAVAKWHSMNPDKQAGVLSLAAARAEEDMRARSRQQAQQRETMQLSAEEQAAAKAAGLIPLRQSRGSFNYAPPGGQKADSLQKLNSDVEKLSGGKLNEWIGAPEKWEDGGFVYAGKRDAVTTIVPGSKGGSQLKMPREQFDRILERYKALEGTTAAGTDAAPVAQKVRVKAPDGRTGFLPAEELDEALKAGWQRIE